MQTTRVGTPRTSKPPATRSEEADSSGAIWVSIKVILWDRQSTKRALPEKHGSRLPGRQRALVEETLAFRLGKAAEIKLDALGLETMASGHLCLNLSEGVEWEEFERYAAKVVALLGARKTAVASGPEMFIWDVALDGAELALVWNDYPAMTSLESSSSEGDALLSLLFSQLKESQPNR